ncbi:hypothetical protein BDR03DRAFT_956494 [Suillus americanus]|nr:hypothetical protein BDR03DRAFT_956494 [Suillus americanus]
MKFSLSQTNARGSVEVASPTFNIPRLRLSRRYLHMLWSGSAATHEDHMDEDDTDAGDERNYTDDRSVGVETLELISVSQASGEAPHDIRSQNDFDIDAAETEIAFQRLRSPVAAALETLAKHCPPQFGRRAKTKRQYSSLEQENSPKIARKRRHLIGWGRPRQEEDLLSWLTHALTPSDVHAQDKKIAKDPCDSEVGNASPKSGSHVSVKRLKTTRRTSLTSIPEERWSYWLTRPLRTTRTSDISAQGDLQPATSPPDHSQTPPIPPVRFSSASAYASCFANPQRQPSVIRWKLP